MDETEELAEDADGSSVNGLAVASLVLGVVWIYWLGSVVAIVLGHVALRQIRSRSQDGAGLAIAGIVLGWLGLGVLVVALLLRTPLLSTA